MWDDAVQPFIPEEHEAQEGREGICEEDQEGFAEEEAKVRIVKMGESTRRAEIR